MFPYTWIVPALPLLACIIIILLTIKHKDLSSYISIGAVIGSFFISCALLAWAITNPKEIPLNLTTIWFSSGTTNIGLGLIIDNLSIMMLVVVSLISLLVQIYSIGYMHGDAGLSRYYAFLSLFTFSMLFLVLSNNFVQMYICWELVGVCSYLLIGFWYHKPSAAEAGKKAFIVTRIGDIGFLLGILLLFSLTGTFSFEELGAIISNNQSFPTFLGLTSQQTLILAAILVFCGAVGKSAQFPLHVWLPDAMEGPTPVSALIHAATMVVAGVYLVARLFGIFSASPDALMVVAYIGGWTAIFAATIAVAQNDIKRIVAYSTLSQLGYMMLSLGVGGYTASMFHLMTHAFFKALLFLGAGSVIHAIHSNNIWDAGGLSKPMKVTAITFVFGALALAGIPPLSGFWSKDEILVAVFNSGNMLLFSFAIITVFLTAFYIFRLYFVVFTGKEKENSHAHESPVVMTVPMIILAVLSVVAGLVGSPWTDNWFGKFIYFGDSTGAHSEHAESHLPMFLGLGMAIFGIFVAWSIYRVKWLQHEKIAKFFGPITTLLANKYWIDELYDIIFVKPLRSLTRIALSFDLRVIDGVLVNGSALTMRGFGLVLRIAQSGLVQFYMLIITIGIIGFLIYKLF